MLTTFTKSFAVLGLGVALCVPAMADMSTDFASDYTVGEELSAASNGEWSKAHLGYYYNGYHPVSNNFNVTEKGVDAVSGSYGAAYQANSTADFVDGNVSATVSVDYITSGGVLAIFARNDDESQTSVNARLSVTKHESGALQFFMITGTSNNIWDNDSYITELKDAFSFVPVEEFKGMPLDLSLDLEGDQAKFTVSFDWTSPVTNKHYAASFEQTATIENADLLDAGSCGFVSFENSWDAASQNAYFGGNFSSFSTTSVPEPASLALFGLAGLALLRRRK